MANENTAPLDTLKDESTDTQAVSTPVTYKPGAKGQLGSFSAPKGTVMGAEDSKSILENMQKMLAEYDNPMNKFQNALQKAHAWTQYDKQPAFRNIQEQEEQDRANKYNIMQNMAAFGASQNAAKRNLESLKSGIGAPSAGGTPSAGGDNLSFMTAPAKEEFLRLLNDNKPDEAQAFLQKQLTTHSNAMYGALADREKLSETAKTYEFIMKQKEPYRSLLLRQNFPLAYEPNKKIITSGSQSGETQITPSFMQQQESGAPQPQQPSAAPSPQPSALPSGVSSGPGPRINPQTGQTEQHAGYDIPLAANTPVTTKTHQLLSPIMGGKVMEVTPTELSGGFGNTAVVRGSDGKYYRLAHFNKVNVKPGDTISPETIIGAAGNTGNSRGNHLHIEEIKAKQPSQVTEQGEIPTVESKERGKQFTDAALKEAGVETGKRRAALEKSRDEISSNQQDARTALNILDKSPKSVGITYGNKLTGSLAEGIKFVTGKDVEPLLERQLTPDEIKNRKIFESSANRLALAYRSSVFKGTGNVSDLETKAATEASGLQSKNPAEANRYFAILYAENFRAHEKLINAWDDYQQNHGGSKADYGQFERTDAFKNVFKEKEERLKSHFPELSSSEIGFGEKKQNTGPSEDELNTWKNRYGTNRTNK